MRRRGCEVLRNMAGRQCTADRTGAARYAPTACVGRRRHVGYGEQNTSGATGTDDEVRAAPEVASSRQSEAALGD